VAEKAGGKGADYGGAPGYHGKYSVEMTSPNAKRSVVRPAAYTYSPKKLWFAPPFFRE